MDAHTSRTKNTLITPCAIRKRVEDNSIDRFRRRNIIELLTAPSYVPANPQYLNEGSSTLDDMCVICLLSHEETILMTMIGALLELPTKKGHCVNIGTFNGDLDHQN